MDIVSLNELPKSSDQDSYDFSIRITTDQSCQAVVIVEITPTAGTAQRGSVVLKESDQCQQLETVYQSGPAKEVWPGYWNVGRTLFQELRGARFPVEQQSKYDRRFSGRVSIDHPIRNWQDGDSYARGEVSNDRTPPLKRAALVSGQLGVVRPLMKFLM